jgi:murein DD-endopeptidase MepM/ murein hydrolase activator NlpD
MIKKVPVKKPSLPRLSLSSESLFLQSLRSSKQFGQEFREFSRFFYGYNASKIASFSRVFEGNKNRVVKNVLIKRGKRNRMFLHVSAMGVLSIGITISPLISGTDLLNHSKNNISYAQENLDSVLAPQDVFNTQKSDKPRDKILDYTVQKGDTLSTIAKKFSIDENTIRWANDMSGDTITDGDVLKILPVSGIAHKVANGDTVYTIAKKYSSNPQAIVDFPFNDFANPQTFSLIEGQMLIVPDGVKPEEKNSVTPRFQPRYLAQVGNESVVGGFSWPIHGTMNQYYSWYHPGVDLGAPIGTPVISAVTGTVSLAITGGWNTGYGTYVMVAGDNGYTTLYAHMMAVNVSVGQRVTAGQNVVGWVGLTGRTTGPHLHFEVRNSGGAHMDPLGVLH